CFNKSLKLKWITPRFTITAGSGTSVYQVGKSWVHRQLRNYCLSRNAAIFCFSFLQVAFGSGEAVTAELTAIVRVPAANTTSILFSVMPPIATWPTPVSVKIGNARLT